MASPLSNGLTILAKEETSTTSQSSPSSPRSMASDQGALARKAGGSLEEQLNEANQMIVHYVKAKDSAVKSREEAILNYKRKKAECENVSETLKEALAEQDRLRQDNEELKANETTLRRDLDDAKQRARDCVSLVETVVKDKAQLKTDSSNLADEKARVEHQLAENEAKLAQAQATLRRWAKNVGKLQEKVEEDQRSLDLNTSTSIKSENASTASPDESQTNVPRARASTPDQKPNIPDPASANKRSTYRYDLSIDGSPDSKSKSFWPNRCRVCDKSFRTHADVMSHIQQHGHNAPPNRPHSTNKRPYVHENDIGRIDWERDPRRRRME